MALPPPTWISKWWRSPSYTPPLLAPLLPTLVRADHKWRDANLLATVQTLSVSLEHIHVGTLGGLSDETVPCLARERTRVDGIVDWLDGQASQDGFAPGWFSLMDIVFIVHIQFSETRNGLQWQDRNNLDRLFDAFAGRPSVAQTVFPWMA